jgi:hypothetical protein
MTNTPLTVLDLVLIVTTITHDHVDRVRSYELLAEEWARRS